jgi:hypothetical protein
VGDHTASPDNGAFADGHTTKYGRIATNGCTAFDERRNAFPVCFGLQFSPLVRGPWILVVDEHHAVTDKDAVLNGHAFADEGVTGNLDPTADLCAFLDFHKRANLRLVANFTAVQIDEGIDLDISAQRHVGCDAHKIPWSHQSPPGFRY